MSKTSTITITIILLVYFMFTSGIVYEATKTKAIDYWDSPYSVALSAERTGLVGIATKEDIECIKWLANESNQDLMIVSGYNGRQICAAYMPVYPRLINVVGNAPPTFNRFPAHCYMFITTWNTQHEQYIEPLEAGLRVKYDLPSIVKYKELCKYHVVEAGSGEYFIVPINEFIWGEVVFNRGESYVYEINIK